MFDIGKFLHESEYDYEVSHPQHPEVVFYCKSLSTREKDRLAKKYTGKQKAKGQAVIKEDDDGIGLMIETFQRIVVNWKGVTDGDSEFPYSQDNLKVFCNKVPLEFLMFIVGKVNEQQSEALGLDEGN